MVYRINRKMFTFDADRFGGVHEFFCNDADSWRNGGRKERCLMFCRNRTENFFDILNETHAEHFIRFIKDYRFHITQIKFPLVYQVL